MRDHTSLTTSGSAPSKAGNGPRQVKQRQLKPLRELAQLQGWLSPLPDCPIRVEARKIPDVFMPQRGKLCQPRAKPWGSEPPNPKP